MEGQSNSLRRIQGCEIPPRWYVSAKFTPTAVCLKRTSPGAGSGTCHSCQFMALGGPNLWITCAFDMVLIPNFSNGQKLLTIAENVLSNGHIKPCLKLTNITTSVKFQSSGINPASIIAFSSRFSSAVTRRPTFAAWRWAASLSFVCRSCLRLASEMRCKPRIVLGSGLITRIGQWPRERLQT